DPGFAERVQLERMRARRRLGALAVEQVCLLEAASSVSGDRVSNELVDRDAPEVVAVRAERKQVRRSRLVQRLRLEGLPAVVDEISWAPNGADELEHGAHEHRGQN